MDFRYKNADIRYYISTHWAGNPLDVQLVNNPTQGQWLTANGKRQTANSKQQKTKHNGQIRPRKSELESRNE
jgi:hypothetical protein